MIHRVDRCSLLSTRLFFFVLHPPPPHFATSQPNTNRRDSLLFRVLQMNIYFCGSIRGGRQDVAIYQQIVTSLKPFGKVLTEHVAFPELELGKKSASSALTFFIFPFAVEKSLTDAEILERDMLWLSQSDVVVAEVTQPSLGVGFEIARAITLNKPVLCLFRPSSGFRKTNLS